LKEPAVLYCLLFSFFGAAVVFCTLYCFLQHMHRLVNVFVMYCIGIWHYGYKESNRKTCNRMSRYNISAYIIRVKGIRSYG
jgi:hypothetical protein